MKCKRCRDKAVAEMPAPPARTLEGAGRTDDVLHGAGRA
jgi:hypothetical protein